jgi:hypothetical protein
MVDFLLTFWGSSGPDRPGPDSGVPARPGLGGGPSGAHGGGARPPVHIFQLGHKVTYITF